MYLSIFFLLMSWTASGQLVNFTINRIDLQALPSSTIRNGETLRLRCAVDIAKTTDFELTSTFYFYKDDRVIYNVTTTNTHAIYIIQNASVSRTGLYKCQIHAETRQKMSEEIKVRVTGLFAPLITVSKIEVTEGDEITVRCEAPNEEPPMYFNFYKTGKERAPVKARNSADNKMETKYEIKEGESILFFECAVKLLIPDEPESPLSRRQTVTVVELFPRPRLTLKPANKMEYIYDGDLVSLECSVSSLSYEESSKMDFYFIVNKGERRNMRRGGKYQTYMRATDSGVYTCEVTIANITKTSEPLLVKVYAPVREVGFVIIPENGEVDEGAELSLMCKAQYGTLPITFSFYVKKGKDILLTNMTIMDNMHAQHTIPLFTKQNEGSYFCTASNKANMSVWSGTMEVKAVLARWKKGVIGAFVFFIILAAICIGLYLYLNEKKKGKNITTNFHFYPTTVFFGL